MHGSEIALVPGARPVQRVFELAGMTERLPFLQGQEVAAATSEADGALLGTTTHSSLDEQLACQAPSKPRARSLTLLRVSGRHSQARRARRAGLVGGV